MNKHGITAQSSWLKDRLYSGTKRSQRFGETLPVCKRCEILLRSKLAGIPTNGFCETCFDEIMDTE